MANLKLSDFKAVRAAHGGTINDVILAVVAGGLRAWLLSRGERVNAAVNLRAGSGEREPSPDAP